jgi:hypothetical protein
MVVRIDPKIDLIMLYKLLRIVYERSMSSEVTLTSLFNEFRNREGIKVNYLTVKKHIEYAVSKGLVEVRGKRPSTLTLTKKGIDFLFLFDRLKELVSESF